MRSLNEATKKTHDAADCSSSWHRQRPFVRVLLVFICCYFGVINWYDMKDRPIEQSRSASSTIKGVVTDDGTKMTVDNDEDDGCGELYDVNPLRSIDALDPSARFSFVHISKCAGAAWIRFLRGEDGPLREKLVFPPTEAGNEISVQQVREHIEAEYTLISVRSPRHHVWSMFAECRYGYWSGIFWKKPASFLYEQNNLTEEAAFDLWLSKFVEEDNNSQTGAATTSSSRTYMFRETLEMFSCYHPSNFQSRFLTSNHPHPQDMDSAVGFEPNTTLSLESLRSLDWFASKEFFHESKCVLIYRLLLGARQHEKDEEGYHRPSFETFLDEKCRCHDTNGTATQQMVTSDVVQHHTSGRRSTMLDLSEDILAKVAALTRSDVVMYKAALDDFMRAVVEVEASLGHRFMCDSSLNAVTMELAYLGVNVFETYHNHSKCSIQKRRKT